MNGRINLLTCVCCTRGQCCSPLFVCLFVLFSIDIDYLEFNSSHLLTHKRSVVRSLLDRDNAVSSNDVVKNAEISRIRSTLAVNNYPKHL